MKNFLFLLYIPFFTFGQVQLTPQNYTVVSSGSSEGYDRPRVIVTANNYPFIIWSKLSSPKSIRAKKMEWNNFWKCS